MKNDTDLGKDIDLCVCKKCEGKGWYYVNEFFLGIQGRKDCICNDID